jgi:N-acetylglucosamine-6-phosphate deacetylase
LIIKNAMVYGEDFRFTQEDIYIKGEKITGKYCDSYEVIDATGLYAIPGLTDIHFHGCAGYDFCDGNYEALNAIAHYQASNGITTICPATMTLDMEELERILDTASSYSNQEGAIFCGIYMEGPFISAIKKGAQRDDYIRKPDYYYYQNMQKISGNRIKVVTIAPEIDGAMDFINEAKDEVVISIAHTAADYDTADEALNRGAKQITHLYNAMPPLNHRNPGVIGAALDHSDCMVELICDGLHIHPSVIRATFQMFGEDRIILISDSMMATGMPDGEYSLGGQDVKVTGQKATLLADGALAGSVTNLMECVRYLVSKVGIPIESAIKCAAVNPAKAIGIYDTFGSISKGKMANIVLMDKDFNIVNVVVKGKLVKAL